MSKKERAVLITTEYKGDHWEHYHPETGAQLHLLASAEQGIHGTGF